MKSQSNQINGNNCGHNPDNPRLQPLIPISKGKGCLPRILSLAAERSKSWYDQPQTCSHLQSMPNRKTRSERREAIIIVIETLLKHMDLATLSIVFLTRQGFTDIDMKSIVRESGLDKRRCERAINNLKKAGFLIVNQPRIKKAQGKYVALRAVRIFTKAFFEWLGLKNILEKEIAKATIRNTTRLIKTLKKVANPISVNKKIVNNSGTNKTDIEFKRKWSKTIANYLKQGFDINQAQKATNTDFNLPLNWSSGQALPKK